MKTRSIIVLILSALFVAVVSAQPTGKRVVDFTADEMRNLRLDNDSMGWILVGRVVFHHNGAVITCDSAVRYSERRMECFGSVVINQNDTYVYGDRADYNGERNIANVYAPIIKIVDKDAVMYTYHFSYNTFTKIGEFRGTGTLAQRDNLFESERGYYYTDTRTLVGVERAQLRNEDYQMVGDSISYNMNTEWAEFYTRSTIWNRASGEILSADRGAYDRATTTYHFYSDSYALTSSQELWADTLDYNGTSEDAVLRRNIQIRDEEHGMMAFGDYGLYFGAAQEAMLTDNPSGIRYDTTGQEDSLYMRADTMFLYTTFSQRQVVQTANLPAVDSLTADSPGMDSVVPMALPTVQAATLTQIDTLRTVRAYRDVKIFRNDFQAICDSMVAFSVDSTAHLYIDPVMWNGQNQITSDSVTIFSKNQELQRAVFAGGEPIMIGRVDNQRYNQIKGKQIVAHFRDNDIYRTDINGNGQTLYYMTEQDSLGREELTGFMTIECANISFDIRDQDVERMAFKGQPVYFIYPMDQIPADQPQRLSGFTWQVARKPTLEQIFHDRQVRPTRRAEYEALPLPTFPLSESIHAHIAQMLKDDIWRQRNDRLSEETLDFIRSLR